MNTPRRTVRVNDELWRDAQTAALERGNDLSEVIRRALFNYTYAREDSQ